MLKEVNSDFVRYLLLSDFCYLLTSETLFSLLNSDNFFAYTRFSLSINSITKFL